MKTVFSNTDEAIHVFAQQQQTDIKNSSRNIFCECSNYDLNYANKIYSYGYHYLLGEFIDKNTILINDKGYSVTTSKHISSLRYATRQYKQFFVTETDLKTVHYSVNELYKKWIKARKPEIYLSEINRLFTKLNEYIEYRKLKVKRSSEYKSISKIYKLVNNDTKVDLEQFRKEQKRNEQQKKRKELKKKLNLFYTYKTNFVRTGQNEDFLRLSKCSNYVETTQGVKVDVNEAKILYKMILAGKDIKGYKIGYYTVIGLNGVLKIGCHRINKKSMHEIGEKLLKY